MSRTYTARQQRTELARIDAQLVTVRRALEAFATEQLAGPITEAVGTAWNALHDAERALEADRREVELNRLTGTTAALVAANID